MTSLSTAIRGNDDHVHQISMYLFIMRFKKTLYRFLLFMKTLIPSSLSQKKHFLGTKALRNNY